jgi:hypothetical protein
VTEVIAAGTSDASAGTAGTAAAPQASTTVGARQLPWPVRTTNPPPAAFRTEVTVVPVRTGAADVSA